MTNGYTVHIFVRWEGCIVVGVIGIEAFFGFVCTCVSYELLVSHTYRCLFMYAGITYLFPFRGIRDRDDDELARTSLTSTSSSRIFSLPYLHDLIDFQHSRSDGPSKNTLSPSTVNSRGVVTPRGGASHERTQLIVRPQPCSNVAANGFEL